MKRLVVVGAGGHGREILDIVAAINAQRPAFDVVGVVDANDDPHGLLAKRGVGVVGEDVFGEDDMSYVPAIGDPNVRRAVAARAEGRGARPATVVHPTAILGPDLVAGEGLVVFPGVVVSTNIRIGRHVHVNVASTISHDCVLGDFVTLSPGCHVSGTVTLGDDVTLGVGAVVRQGITIGAGTFVGAGAVVVKDLPPGITAVGVPARPLAR